MAAAPAVVPAPDSNELIEFLAAHHHRGPAGIATAITDTFMLIPVGFLPPVEVTRDGQRSRVAAARHSDEDGVLDLSVDDRISDTTLVAEVLAVVAIIRWRQARPTPDPTLVEALTPIIRAALGTRVGAPDISVGPVNVDDLARDLALSGRIAVRDVP